MSDTSEPCVLYHNLYSLCSIMVRYTIAIAGEPRDASSRVAVREESVDIFHDAQLDENYLLKLNAKGQVPVLAPPAPAKPIPDSLEITEFLGERYPGLYPASHRAKVVDLLQSLHSLSYFSLSFLDKPQLARGFLKAINDRLARDDISDEYRKALEYKLSVTSEKAAGTDPAAAAKNEAKTKQLMSTLESHLSEESPWLFGVTSPSALDAHLVVLLARLRDVGRNSLVPADLQRYAETAWKTAAFRKVMDGRTTMKAM